MNGVGVVFVDEELPDSYADCRVGDAILQFCDDIKPKPVRWLWHNRIALGKITMLAGDPGLGKSFVTLDWAARVSRNLPWPDGSPGTRGSAVLLSAEDDPADTVVPRLNTAGATLANLAVLRAVVRFDGKQHSFSLEQDIERLEHAIKGVAECRLVVIDPITAYCGATDSHKNAEIRSLLTPLAELAAKHRVAVVCVSHLNKGQGAAIYRTMGSLAFVAAARAAYVVAKDKNDPKRRLFMPIKNNLGDDTNGLAYRIVDGRIEWEPDLVNMTADEALGDEQSGKRSGPKVNEDLEYAKDWLLNQVFKDQTSIPSKEVEEWAEAEMISKRQLNRAKKELGVTSKRQASIWHWSLELSPVSPTSRP